MSICALAKSRLPSDFNRCRNSIEFLKNSSENLRQNSGRVCSNAQQDSEHANLPDERAKRFTVKMRSRRTDCLTTLQQQRSLGHGQVTPSKSQLMRSHRSSVTSDFAQTNMKTKAVVALTILIAGA